MALAKSCHRATEIAGRDTARRATLAIDPSTGAGYRPSANPAAIPDEVRQGLYDRAERNPVLPSYFSALLAALSDKRSFLMKFCQPQGELIHSDFSLLHRL
jgi:hypothetical protein